MGTKKKVIILVVICLIVLIGAFVLDNILGKSYLNEIKYDELMEKIENKEDLVLLISQTTCTHCASYKPKLEDIAKEYKIDIYYIEADLLTDDERNELKSHINFSSTPVTVFLKGGEETTVANRISGDASKDKIERKLKSNGLID